jgi:RimJ/RimL family protein N-acetyltransferase
MRISFGRPNKALARDLETENFRLRSLTLLEAMWLTDSWRGDFELLGSMHRLQRPFTRLEWARRGPIPNNVTRFAFDIIPKQTGRSIGVHGVHLRDYRSANTQIALSDRTWWGRDAVVEVRARLINHFFRHADISRFESSVEGRNMAGIFIYRRLGFTHVGTLHRARRDPVSGRALDVLFFELLREDWERGPFAEAAPMREAGA